MEVEVKRVVLFVQQNLDIYLSLSFVLTWNDDVTMVRKKIKIILISKFELNYLFELNY